MSQQPTTSNASQQQQDPPKKVGRTPSLHGFLTQTDAQKEELYRQIAEDKKKERMREMTGDYNKAQAEARKN